MFKLDFSELHANGFMINQLRLFHTSKFRGLNFMKNKEVFMKNEDLTGERNLISEYIIERMEICYTQYIVFAGLTFLSVFLLIVTFFVPTLTLTHRLIPFVSMVVCWFVANKGKGNFVMANVGLGLSESIYNFKIKEKYNL
jgi:hypothetical protein